MVGPRVCPRCTGSVEVPVGLRGGGRLGVCVSGPWVPGGGAFRAEAHCVGGRIGEAAGLCATPLSGLCATPLSGDPREQ